MNKMQAQGNPQEFLNSFMQFRNSFTGDPRQQIQQLMNSGKVTQDQYNQAVQTANMLRSILKI